MKITGTEETNTVRPASFVAKICKDFAMNLAG